MEELFYDPLGSEVRLFPTDNMVAAAGFVRRRPGYQDPPMGLREAVELVRQSEVVEGPEGTSWAIPCRRQGPERRCYRCGRRTWTDDWSRCPEGCQLLTRDEEIDLAKKDPYLDAARRRENKTVTTALVVTTYGLSLNMVHCHGTLTVIDPIPVGSIRGGWSQVPSELKGCLCCVLGIIDPDGMPDEVFADWLRDTCEAAGCRIGP